MKSQHPQHGQRADGSLPVRSPRHPALHVCIRQSVHIQGVQSGRLRMLSVKRMYALVCAYTRRHLDLHDAALLREQHLHLRVDVVDVAEVDDLDGSHAWPGDL